jgi:hypothetical protein
VTTPAFTAESALCNKSEHKELDLLAVVRATSRNRRFANFNAHAVIPHMSMRRTPYSSEFREEA